MTWKNLKKFSRGKNESPKVSKLTSARNDKNEIFKGIFQHSVTIQTMRHFIFWKVMESRWLGSQTTQWVARFLLWCSLCGRREKMKLEKTSHANSALLHLVFYAKCKVFQVFQSLIDLFFNAPKTCQGFYIHSTALSHNKIDIHLRQRKLFTFTF